MGKVKNTRKRLLTLVLALAMVLTSVSVPSATAEAAKKVKVKKIQVTSPKKKTVTLVKGKTLQIKVKVTPKNASNKKVSYKSSKKKIASVSSKGKVKGVKKGTAKITITAKDGSKKKATLTVKVVNPVKVKKVALNKKTATVYVGKKVTLKATVTPKNATNKAVSWKTSSSKIAKVSSKGVVTGVKAGTATITATAKDGSKKKATCKVTVKKASTPTPTPIKKALEGIAVTKAPTKTDYFVGDKFDPAGMEVKATYSDKSTKALAQTAYKLTPAPTATLRVTDKAVTVSYTEGSVTKTATTPISVKIKPSEQSIEVTTMPTKTTYVEGEKFDPAGMVVTATLSDKTTKEITDYTYSEEPLEVTVKDEKTIIEISYKVSSSKTLKAEVPILVTAKDPLASIRAELLKTVLEKEGACFNDDDVAVTATFESGKTAEVSMEDCTVDPAAFTLDTTSATITYRYGGIERSVEVNGFTVTAYRERYTFEDAKTVGTIVKRENENGNAVPTEEFGASVVLGEDDFVDGVKGKALKLDGTYGLRLDKIAGTASKNYSISAWFKPEETLKGCQALIISTANKFGLTDGLPETWCAVAGNDPNNAGKPSDNRLKLWSHEDPDFKWQNVGKTANPIPVGADAAWTHVALVVDDAGEAAENYATGTLYVNGRKACSGKVRNEKGELMKTYLGVTGWSADGYFKGQIDELVFTNEVLTQDDVEAYYLEGMETSGSQYKEITKVSPDDGAEVEVDYGTSLADVKRELTKIPYRAAAEGEEPMEFTTSSDMWTVKGYTITSEGDIEATVKLEAPEGYMFNIGGRLSVTVDRKATVKVKEPVVISAVTPSEASITVPYGADEAMVKEELAKLAFTVTTSDSSAYEIANVKSKWTLTEAENGYKAAFDLGIPEVGYKYAEGLKVEVAVSVAEAIKITGLTVTPATLEVDFGTPETAVKEELAKLAVSAAVAAGSEAPVISNAADLWTITDYAAETAGSYTAKAVIAAPVGYAFNEGVSNEVSVAVTVKAAGEHKLSRIVVTTPPSRTKYLVGDAFDKTGMAITAYYGDGQHEDVTAKAVVEEAANLTLDKASITITYTEGEGAEAIEKTCTQAITVKTVAEGAASYYTFDGTLVNAQNESKVAKTVKLTGYGQYADTNLTDIYDAEDGINGASLSVKQDVGVEIPESISAEQKAFTISLWAKKKAGSKEYSTIFFGKNPDAVSQYGKGIVFYANPGNNAGKMELQVSNSNTETNAKPFDVPTDKWTMLTFVNKPDSMEFYIDGKAQDISEADKAKMSVAGGIERMILGIGQWNAADILVGNIDEVRIYDSSLNDKQVKELYDLVTPTISSISVDYNQDDFTFLKSELGDSTERIQTALKALAINVTMKNGAAPEFKNDTDWTLTPKEDGLGYTATKELEIPAGYALVKGASKTLTVNVIVKDATLESVAVSQSPNKITYKVGETFDKTGMKLTATYSDKSTKEVAADAITVGENGVAAKPNGETGNTWKQEVTVSYTDGGVEQSTTQEITVIDPATSMGAVLAARTAYYTFDNTLADSVKGNTVGKSVKHRTFADVTIADAERYAEDGKKGACLNVNKDGVQIPDTISAEQKEFTINLWVKKTASTTAFGPIFQGKNSSGNGKGVVFYANPGGNHSNMQLEGNGGNGKVFACADDEWTMLTFVNKTDNTEFYINGNKQDMTAEEAGKYVVTKGIDAIILGTGQWMDSEFFVGCIDEVSLYNVALEGNQITLLKEEAEGTLTE